MDMRALPNLPRRSEFAMNFKFTKAEMNSTLAFGLGLYMGMRRGFAIPEEGLGSGIGG